MSNRALTKGAAWGDFNDDGYPDLYVSNFQGANRMYRNDGDGKFTDVASALGVDGPYHSYSAWFWDVDNDGALDLLVNSYRTPQTSVPDVWYYAADLLGYEHPAEKLALFKGDGGGSFVDVAAEYGVARVSLATGANFGDLDNDGWLDFYLGTGYPGFEALFPNLMYRNQGGTGFVDVTYAGGFGHLQRGQGVAFADYDNDGDQDVFERMGGLLPGDEVVDALYRNPGFDNNWLTLDLRSPQSNRFAVGAKITAQIVDGGVSRTLTRVVGQGGSFGANPLRVHLGLGGATRVDRLHVVWPATRQMQTFTNLTANEHLLIQEGFAEPRTLPAATTR